MSTNARNGYSKSRAREDPPLRRSADFGETDIACSMQSAAGSAPSFKGLPLPVGVERHNLYTSSFRVINRLQTVRPPCTVGPARGESTGCLAWGALCCP